MIIKPTRTPQTMSCPQLELASHIIQALLVLLGLAVSVTVSGQVWIDMDWTSRRTALIYQKLARLQAIKIVVPADRGATVRTREVIFQREEPDVGTRSLKLARWNRFWTAINIHIFSPLSSLPSMFWEALQASRLNYSTSFWNQNRT